jgi:hypothetical protein
MPNRLISQGHVYTEDLSELVGPKDNDLAAEPRCPADSGADITDDYTVVIGADDTITIYCSCDDGAAAASHNTVDDDPNHGFTPGLDAE